MTVGLWGSVTEQGWHAYAEMFLTLGTGSLGDTSGMGNKWRKR